MDNRSDIEAICEVLEKEHNDVAQALVRSAEGPGAHRASANAGQARRRSSAGQAAIAGLGTPLSDHEEVHLRDRFPCSTCPGPAWTLPGPRATARSLFDHHSLCVPAQVHSRIGVIEETLRMCDSEIRSIQEHLHLLPQLCELLNIPLSTLDDASS